MASELIAHEAELLTQSPFGLEEQLLSIYILELVYIIDR